MRNLAQLLVAHPFPESLDRIKRSFARQPDIQTCGASAIRHGLLLGGLTIPTAALEAILEIRNNEGTTPKAMRTCLSRLGFEARPIRKPKRLSTASFFDRLSKEFQRGAFLYPCVDAGEHWICVGSWLGGKIVFVDSFFDKIEGYFSKIEPTIPGLGFFSLSPDEFDKLNWAHHMTIVRPGYWTKQYRAWLPARATLLRQETPKLADGSSVTVVDALRIGTHQYLDDADYNYRQLAITLAGGHVVSIRTEDKGRDPVGVETEGGFNNETVVVSRLEGILSNYPAVPELVLRSKHVQASYLA